jgi:hypothetical protein
VPKGLISLKAAAHNQKEGEGMATLAGCSTVARRLWPGHRVEKTVDQEALFDVIVYDIREPSPDYRPA